MIICFLILELLATFIEDMIVLMLGVKISKCNKIMWKKTVACAIILTLITWCINQIQLFSVYLTIFLIFAMTIGICLIYKTKIVDTIILVTSFFVILYVVDFFSITMLGLAFDKGDIVRMIAEKFSLMRAIAIIISKFLLILFYYFFINRISQKIKICVWKAIFGLFTSCGILHYLIQNSFEKVHMSIVLLWTLLLSLFFIIIYSINQYMVYMRERAQLLLANKKNLLTAEHYERVIHNYNVNQIFYHDLKNQYLILKRYLENKEYEKAEEYMQDMAIVNYEGAVCAFTGEETVDILIDYKKKEAEKLGIKVIIIAECIKLSLTKYELTALLGNAIDNAIEACKKVRNNSKWIRIVISKVNNISYIKVENSYEIEPKVRKGKFLTIKDDEKLHGMGIDSMRLIVNKYGGDMDIEYEKGVFVLSVAFFE